MTVPIYTTADGLKIELPFHATGKWQLVPWWHYQRWYLSMWWIIPILRTHHVFRRQHFQWIIDHQGCCGDYVWEYGGKEVE